VKVGDRLSRVRVGEYALTLLSATIRPDSPGGADSSGTRPTINDRVGALVDLMRRDALERQRAERERELQAEATAEAMVRRMREYTPNPPYSRPIYADLSPEGKEFFTKLARQRVDRQEFSAGPFVSRSGHSVRVRPTASPALGDTRRSAEAIEAMRDLVRQGIELLAQRDRVADERDRRADERDRKADRRARLTVLLAVASVIVGARDWLTDLLALLG